MRRLLICWVLFLLFGSQKALAEIFVVNTTNPTGAGSLGEALDKAAANGTNETDYIYFNITRARDYFILYVYL